MKWLLSLFCVAGLATCQAQQTLGDAARQNRLQKPPSNAKHVITNDEIPSVIPEESRTVTEIREEGAHANSAASVKTPKDAELIAKVRAQKQKVKKLEQEIAAKQSKLDNKDCPAGVTCGPQKLAVRATMCCDLAVTTCDVAKAAGIHYYDDWCNAPDKLQDEIDADKKRLDEERRVLEGLQEEARKKGYGNAAYDPD